MSLWNTLFPSPSPSTIATQPREYILQPANPLWVGATILVSILLDFVLHRAAWVPDFVAITLFFWTLRQPNWVGMLIAFLCGILIDVQQGSLLGQHALAYVILSYMAVRVQPARAGGPHSASLPRHAGDRLHHPKHGREGLAGLELVPREPARGTPLAALDMDSSDSPEEIEE